jgi:uncharacterized protein (TIGR03435 family)
MKSQLAPLIVLSLAATLHAQAPPTFEAAVITRVRQTPIRSSVGRLPGSNYVVPGMTVVQLVGSAYGVPPDRVLGAPRWATTDLYEIHAKAAGNPTGAEMTLLLQSLLRDRFKLTVREELRDSPVYVLKVAHDDGRLGSRMRLSAIDCSDPESRKRAEARPNPGNGPPPCTSQFAAGAGRIVGSSVSMGRLAPMLTGPTGRTVLDRTGLAGGYDIDLEWSVGTSPDKPSILAAVQEQLGLRLESATAPLAVVLIERVERPTEK